MLPKPAEKIRDIIKFIKNNRKPPQALLLENVKNFKTHDKSKTYARVRRELNELGYSVYTKVLNTAKFTNIPQNRERTFMVCFYGEKKWIKYSLDELEENEIDDKMRALAKKYCPKTYHYHENFLKMRPVKQKPFREFLDPPDKIDDKYFITNRYPQLYKICHRAIN